MRLLAILLIGLGTAAAAPKPWIDAPAWKTGDRVELSWIIGADRPNPHDPYGGGLPLRPVTLVATLGGVSRQIALAPETGNLMTYNQIMCHTSTYPLEKGEVGKLTFYEGGASGYLVRRPANDVLEIHHWAQTDGACESPKGEMVACPGQDELVARLHVPERVEVASGVVLTTERGKLQPITCERD